VLCVLRLVLVLLAFCFLSAPPFRVATLDDSLAHILIFIFFLGKTHRLTLRGNQLDMSTLALDTDVQEEAKKRSAEGGGKAGGGGGGEAKESAAAKFDAIAEGDEEEELTSGDEEDDGM